MNKRYNEQDPAPQYDPETARIRRALRAQKARRRKKMRSRRLFLLGMALILLFVLVPNLWGRAERLLYPRKYEALVDQWAETYGLDPLLVDAFIRTESGFDPDAVSRADAMGLMQLTEDTFEWALSRMPDAPELTTEDLFTPAVNIQYGTYVLKLLGEQFEVEETVLAAYNPKLFSPVVEVPERYLFADEFPQDSLPYGFRWWKLFDDPALDSLMELALANNRNLAAAASRVEQARLNLGIVRAQYLPQFGVGVSAGADYNAEQKIVQEYAIEPSLSWEISLFGALKHSERAAQAQILSTEWAFRGVLLSLTAEVATTYYTLLQYDRDLQIARQSYELRRQSAALIDSMFRYGMSNGVALQQARSLVYSAAADIPQYRRAVEQAQLSLNILLGQPPRRIAGQSGGDSLIARFRPLDIPVGLPSDLLYRRPDVMQSYYDLQEAAARVGVARSARFPSLSLTGKGGVVSSTVEGLGKGNPWAWSAAAALTEPIFAFGRLKRQEASAREAYYQSVFAYEQAVLEAFSDVEDALVSITTYTEQTERYRKLVDANEQIALMTNTLYRSGMSAYLDVIDAERSLYESQMEYSNLVAQQYINYVNLFKALGGGW